MTDGNGTRHGDAGTPLRTTDDAAPADRAREIPAEAREDVAERPGHSSVDPDHADEVADTWGEESFPASDPPSHY